MIKTPLALSIAIGVALVLQLAATIYALRLVKRTKYNAIWILLVIGFILIAFERYFELRSINGEPRHFYISVVIGIVTAICVSFAVMFAHRLVSYLERIERQKALLNRRILSAVLRTEESSRAKFSKEMHDGLGPLLSAAKMSLSALTATPLTDEQRRKIENSQLIIDEAIRSVREISNNLSPQVLLDFGVAQATKNFIDRCASLHNAKINFSTNLKNERFDNDIEVIIYRVVCELVHNSLKHSGCDTITLDIALCGDKLLLHYHDNGCGFDINALQERGMGLSNIESRINSLDGQLNIESRPNEGMSADIVINCKKNG